jgi:3-dehydroquinate synthase
LAPPDPALKIKTAPAPEPVERRLCVTTPSATYNVELRHDAGAWLIDAIDAATPNARLFILTDQTVAALHADALTRALVGRGRQVTLHSVPAGEGSKTLETASRLYDELLLAGVCRTDAVVALGGGVVGDLAGFVASTILRGIRSVQVPTTTLAAVDASVGGKTAVNSPRGKNLIGTFHQPQAVLIAREHLATQNPRQHAAGLAEVVKIAATSDALLFERVERDAKALLEFAPQPLLDVIARAVELKALVVGRDEREQGERAILNYGHTIGHAIESGERFRLLHGEAVMLGMLAEAEWAVTQGGSPKVVERLSALAKALALPTSWTAARIDLGALALDKKRQGEEVRLPVVPKPGTVELRNVSLEALASFVQRRTAT